VKTQQTEKALWSMLIGDSAVVLAVMIIKCSIIPITNLNPI
jgi:hypothetical protein